MKDLKLSLIALFVKLILNQSMWFRFYVLLIYVL